MNLSTLRNQIARLGATVAPRPRLHRGLLVVFRSCDADGQLIPLPDLPHGTPSARDPRDGLDVLFLDENGAEFQPRCAQ